MKHLHVLTAYIVSGSSAYIYQTAGSTPIYTAPIQNGWVQPTPEDLAGVLAVNTGGAVIDWAVPVFMAIGAGAISGIVWMSDNADPGLILRTPGTPTAANAAGSGAGSARAGDPGARSARAKAAARKEAPQKKMGVRPVRTPPHPDRMESYFFVYLIAKPVSLTVAALYTPNT